MGRNHRGGGFRGTIFLTPFGRFPKNGVPTGYHWNRLAGRKKGFVGRLVEKFCLDTKQPVPQEGCSWGKGGGNGGGGKGVPGSGSFGPRGGNTFAKEEVTPGEG